MSKTNCDPDALRAYLAGELDDEAAGILEAHALECDTCRSIIEKDLAPVAGALKSAVPEFEVPATIHMRINALKKRRTLWARVASAFDPHPHSATEAPEATSNGSKPAGTPRKTQAGSGITRGQFFRRALTTGGLVGGTAASVGAYGLGRFRRLEARVALVTLDFPSGTFNPADNLNEVNLVVEAPGVKQSVALRCTAPLVGDRATLPALPSGLIRIAAERQPTDGRTPAVFYWQGVASGEMQVAIPGVAAGSQLAADASRMLRGVSHSPAEMDIPYAELLRRTFVCYRDVNLAIDGRNVLSEDFSHVAEQGRPASMERYWAGYNAAVTRGFGSPAFVLEFLPNDNEGWSFPLTLENNTGTISYGLQIMTPDATRGGTFGLYGKLGALNTADACEIEFKNGNIMIERRPLLREAQAWRWYQVEVVYHVRSSSADFVIDGVQRANGIRVPGGHIDGFMISGVNYAVKGVDVP